MLAADSVIPSKMASAKRSQYKEIARAASSLPGIGKSAADGSQFVSNIAITGMLRRRASLIAIDSLFVSITNIKSGFPPISLIPPRALSSFPCSRVSWSNSFFVRPEAEASPSIVSSSRRRLIDPDTVCQFVSIPPSQRWLT